MYKRQDPGCFGGQPETGGDHLFSGMTHVTDVDGGNACPDNQAVASKATSEIPL